MLKVYKLLDVTCKKELSFTIIYICNSKSLYECEILDSAVGKALVIHVCALKHVARVRSHVVLFTTFVSFFF